MLSSPPEPAGHAAAPRGPQTSMAAVSSHRADRATPASAASRRLAEAGHRVSWRGEAICCPNDPVMEVGVPGRLDGKVAIVTGAGSIGPGWGNGKATAVLFGRQGARVESGRAHVSTPVTNAQLVCPLLLEKTQL